MHQVTVREVDYGNKVQTDVLLDLMEDYAMDPYGLDKPISMKTKNSLVDELSVMNHAFSFLAYYRKQPAGLANCFTSLSVLHARKVINIHDLFVMKTMRGRGIGKKILRAIQKKAEALHCCQLTLEVREENKEAIRLYERFGFDGDYHMWFMVKEL